MIELYHIELPLLLTASTVGHQLLVCLFICIFFSSMLNILRLSAIFYFVLSVSSIILSKFYYQLEQFFKSIIISSFLSFIEHSSLSIYFISSFYCSISDANLWRFAFISLIVKASSEADYSNVLMQINLTYNKNNQYQWNYEIKILRTLSTFSLGSQLFDPYHQHTCHFLAQDIHCYKSLLSLHPGIYQKLAYNFRILNSLIRSSHRLCQYSGICWAMSIHKQSLLLYPMMKIIGDPKHSGFYHFPSEPNFPLVLTTSPRCSIYHFLGYELIE